MATVAELAPSFDKLMTQIDGCVSYDLLDISTRLDFFDNFPEHQILSTAEKIDRTEIGFEVLRILAFEHFKLFRQDYRIRQKICSKLDIKTNSPSIVGSKDKK